MKKFSIVIQRSWIVLGNETLKSYSAPGLMKIMLSKVTPRIDAFLRDYPGDRYEITARVIDDKETQQRVDRESEEERADPSEGHYR